MRLKYYIAIARPDQWSKNVFMLLGIVLSIFIEPDVFYYNKVWKIIVVFFSTCLVASSNYVINEVLDAKRDLLHPIKCKRPVPSGKIKIPIAYMEWIFLAVLSISIANFINKSVFFTVLFFWITGIFYNVPPIRLKELPYLDVLSESLNNPIRLLLGWFTFLPDKLPPLSLIICYWMVGAFFMAAKRLAEYRTIGAEAASAYRSSFKYYTEEKLIISLFYYSTTCAFFFGVFVIHYHLELVLMAPIMATFFSYFINLTFKEHSVVQSPEKLWREWKFVVLNIIVIVVFVLLLFVDIPIGYKIFKVIPYKLKPLWEIGG